MPIDASIYGNLQLPKLATLGEIAEARAQREDRQMVRDSRKLAMDKQQREAKELQAIQEVFTKYTGPDGPDQTAIVNELFRIAPDAAQKVQAGFAKLKKDAADARSSELDLETKRIAAVSRSLQGVTPDTYPAAFSRIRVIDPEAAEVLGPTYDPAKVDAVMSSGMAWSDYNTKYKDVLAAKEKDEVKALNLISLANDQNQYEDALDFAKVHGVASKIREMGFADQFTPDAAARAAQITMTPEKRATMAATASENEANRALTRRGQDLSASTQRRGQDLANARATETGSGSSEFDELADTVIREPGLWDQLTPTVKGKLATRLSAKGYEGFGKPLSDGAMKQIAESESAVQSLQDLRVTLKNNEQFIGPIAGLQAMNPWSDARKAQAEIDLVRQRVGKALEGGVLRKEDEEKYKKILATLRDTPETSVYKVDQLIKSVTRDIENYKQQQRLSGRRVADAPSPAGAAGEKKNPFRK